MIGTASGFLRENSAFLLAKDEMSARILAAMLFNSQKGRDDKGPTQLFPWPCDSNEEQTAPEGWTTAEIAVGTSIISGGTVVGFEVDSADASLTLQESLDNYLLLPDHIDMDGWRGLTLAFLEYWRTNFKPVTVCGMCQREGEGTSISGSSDMCKHCWGTIVAVATYGYTAEDLVNLEGDCERGDRDTTCSECRGKEVVFGMLGFDEEPFMCGACRMMWAGDELDNGHCERDTGFDPALLQYEKFMDERWRTSLAALAQYRRIPLVEDDGFLGLENPVPQTTVEAGDGGVLGQRPTAKRQNAQQNAEGEGATEGTEDDDEAALPATDGADGAGEKGEGEQREKRKQKKKQKKAKDAKMDGEDGQGGGEAEGKELLQQAQDAEMGVEDGQGQGEEAEGGF